MVELEIETELRYLIWVFRFCLSKLFCALNGYHHFSLMISKLLGSRDGAFMAVLNLKSKWRELHMWCNCNFIKCFKVYKRCYRNQFIISTVMPPSTESVLSLLWWPTEKEPLNSFLLLDPYLGKLAKKCPFLFETVRKNSHSIRQRYSYTVLHFKKCLGWLITAYYI